MTTPPATTTSWPGGAGISADQVPALTCDSSRTVTLYAVDRTTLVPTRVGEADLAEALNGWRGDGSGTCYGNSSWSKDLNKVLIQAIPPGNTSDDTHVAVVDLVSRTVTDLTAPRQGTSFSSAQLDEKTPWFLDRGAKGVPDLVAFDPSPDGRTWKTLRLSDPTTVGTATDAYVQARVAQTTWSSATDHQFADTFVNPSRTLRVSGYGGARTIVVGDRPEETGRPIDCGSVSIAETLGWLDDSRLLVLDTDGAPRTATISANGQARCSRSVVPANDRDVRDVFLLPDLAHIAFRADDPAATGGVGWFAMPIAGGDPDRMTMPEWPEDLVVVCPWPQS